MSKNPINIGDIVLIGNRSFTVLDVVIVSVSGDSFCYLLNVFCERTVLFKKAYYSVFFSKPAIRARIMLDGLHYHEFDAHLWFALATNREIIAAVEEVLLFDSRMPSATICFIVADFDYKVREFLNLCLTATSERFTQRFSLRINITDIMHWLKKHRESTFHSLVARDKHLRICREEK